MPRGERPLGEGEGAPLRLAAELRRLRQRAGSPTYRELARISHYSVAALSSAAAGAKLPSLAVTVAYATACGGDRAEWERRWHALAAEHAREEAARSPTRTPARTSVRSPAQSAAESRADSAPYAGLTEFRAEDASRFFGRERLIEEMTDLLESRRFVTVVGASGAGKSSLLRAGVVPAWLRGTPDRPAVVLTPGPCPLEETATRLAGPAGTSPGALVRDLADSPRALHRAVRQILAERPEGTELLLVVDQFEEVFTLCHDPAERARFIDALLTAATAENSRCRVVVGVRADFYAHCTDHAELGRAMSRAQLPVGPMTTDELRRAVVRPAVGAGHQVEGALVTELVSQAKGQAAVLPLLSHALLETWHRRRGTTLTLAGYQATGGIDGALAHTAESLYGALSPERQRAARDLLLRLTALGEGTEDTKRRITRAELDLYPHTTPPGSSTCTVPPPRSAGRATDTAHVLERFARARLLTLDRDSVEITHEALIRCWPRLRSWLLEDREGQRIHRALTEAAHAWEAVGRDPGALYRGVRLAGARQWAAGHGAGPGAGGVLSDRERAFLGASVAAHEAAERAARRGTRRLRHLTLLLALLLVCTATATGLAVHAQRQATGERDTAVSQRIAEQAAALRPTDPAGALQLGLSAYRLRPTVAARGALLSSFATPYATRLVAAGRVDAVAPRPGGRVLATAERGRAVRLWDIADPYRPRPLATLDGRPGTVRSMAFSPDGRLLAAADEDGRARVWDVSDPAHTGPPAALRGAVVAVAFGRDSGTLATAGGDSAVRLWHTARRCRAAPALTPAGVLPGDGDRLDSLVFGRDGRTLAAGGERGAWLWGLADPAPAQADPAPARPAQDRPPCDAAVQTPRSAVAPAVGPIRVGTLPVRALALSPDGRTLATAGRDHAVRLWNVTGSADVTESADVTRSAGATGSGGPASRTPRAVLTGHTDAVRALAFSRDGRTLASGGVDARIRLWDLTAPAGARLLNTLGGHTGIVASLAFGEDGHTLVSAGDADRTARLWDLPGPVLLGHTSSLYGVTFSPDGRTVATASYDSTVRLWNVRDPYRPVPRSVLAGHTAAVNEVVFAPDGRTLASAGLDRTVRLWDMPGQGTPRPRAPLTGFRDAVNSVAYRPDGRVLAGGGADRTVRLWDTADPLRPKQLTVFTAHGDQVESVAFSRDGRLLATGGADRTVRLWDVTDPRRPRARAVLTAHQDVVKAVAFSPRNGHILATAGDDRALRLWDVTDPRAPIQLSAPGGYTDAVKALAFSPDGRTLATASADRPVRLWDLADPRHPVELAVLTGHTKPVDALAFAPDGRTLATAGEDWTALLRDLDTERVADRICRMTGGSGLSRAEARRFLPGLPYRPPCGIPR
ncbi:AAA family ATPase [Streptomyces sp. NPDC093109]|uniref:nSTAND1 domain-containing NTPase n=1 Tax=Streptomyces sp. NPDC093109 TaxID=3154977 RepID=UPI00344EE763